MLNRYKSGQKVSHINELYTIGQMNIFNKKKDVEKENRLRLQKLVDLTKKTDTPIGWIKRTFAVGGLSEVGFSKSHLNYC